MLKYIKEYLLLNCLSEKWINIINELFKLIKFNLIININVKKKDEV